LLAANLNSAREYPLVSLVHHLRCSEERPRWQNALYRIVESRYLNSVDGFIYNSNTTRSVVTSLVRDEKPGIVAYPPTDRFGNPLSAQVVRARAAESGPLRLLFLGSVISRKGLDTILKALSTQGARRTQREKQATPYFTLDIIGSLTAEPAYAQRMRELASSIGPPSAVRFHGALDEVALAAQLRQAHVLVVPSSYEGFGIVYLEGMAFGLPAIGTTAGAAGEIIRHGETGYLIAPGDVDALAAHLAELAVDRALLVQLSLQAIDRYRQQPPWEQTAGEIREFLKSRRQAP
jgi:glycosyltransferase involved in cell wall biosynthesis